jgi:hypothetical protein
MNYRNLLLHSCWCIVFDCLTHTGKTSSLWPVGCISDHFPTRGTPTTSLRLTREDDDDEDEETLQDRFQLRSRFSRPGLPHVPLVQDPPASLEASLAAPPRKPRNPARKRVTKKLKVSETTPQEVGCLE